MLSEYTSCQENALEVLLYYINNSITGQFKSEIGNTVFVLPPGVSINNKEEADL